MASDDDPGILSEALEHCPDFVLLVDACGKTVYANRQAREWNQECGRTYLERICAEDRESVDALVRKTRDSSEPGACDARLSGPEGVRVCALRIRKISEGLVALYASDVSEERRAVEALQASEEQYRAVFQAINDGLLIKNLDGRIKEVNRAACEMHGLTRDEFLAFAPSDFIHPDSLKSFDEYLAATRRGEQYCCDAQDLRKDGTVIDIEVRGFPFRYQGERHTLGVIRDISDRKRAQAKLTESEGRKNAMIQSALDGILTVDHSGRLSEVNPAAMEILGSASEDVVGKKLVDFLSDSSRAAELETYFAAGPCSVDRLRDRFETEVNGRPTEMFVTKLEVSGQPQYMVFMRDLTERKRLSIQLQQAQKMEVLGRLTGGLAHDFNNLLTVLLGNLGLIEVSLNDPPQLLEYLRRATEATDKASVLTHRLLAYARQQSLRPRSVDLYSLLDGVEDTLRSNLGETIEFQTIKSSDLWRCDVDSSQLEDALLNLVMNARDAMAEGGTLTIEVSNLCLDESQAQEYRALPGDYVQVVVTDTGKGMSEELLGQIFEPFFTTKEVGAGSGLGLSMVYGFVKQSRGFIDVTSQVGVGTRFRMTFPRSIQESNSVSQSKKAVHTRPG